MTDETATETAASSSSSSSTQSDDLAGESQFSTERVIDRLQEEAPSFSVEQAKEIAAMIQSVQERDDFSYIQQESLPTARSFRQDMSAEQVAVNLGKAVDSLKFVENLLVDGQPEGFFEHMKQVNMVPAEHEEEFEENPDLLERHVRQTAYFTITSLALAGGYMPGLEDERATSKDQKAKSSQEGTATADVQVLEKLRKDFPDMDEQVVKDIAAVIYSAQHNEDQQSLREKAFQQVPQLRLELTMDQIGEHMSKSLEGLKRVEDIFRDPNLNLSEMLKHMLDMGVVTQEVADKYGNQPKKVKEHVQTTAYFTFVALAMTGDYMSVHPEERRLEYDV